jgi:periplasmic divalent cation tolerance protein
VDLPSPVDALSVAEVVTRCDDRSVLDRIGDALITARLAACAHVRGPISSTYWWNGAIERVTEWELDVVSTIDGASQVAAHIRTTHAYELPAVVIRVVGVSAEYSAWVADVCTQASAHDQRS